MKLPKRISDILRRKQEYIDIQRNKLNNTIVKLQSQLLDDVIVTLIPELDVKDGMILDTPKNLRLISVLDKTYKNFQTQSANIMLGNIIPATSKIADMSNKYFSVILTEELMRKFERITIKANKLINLRLGLDGGQLVRGGFLESFFNSNTIGTDLKQMTSKAVTSGMGMKEYTSQLRDIITGVDKKAGGLERQFQRYAFDLYQQYDAAYNMILGNEFGFTYFIYQGGLIADSREFCVLHNDKVWSKEEAGEWGEWVSPTTGEKPSYMGYPGYDPLIDRGGYNCRHSLGWVSDDIAFGMRPDLKKN